MIQLVRENITKVDTEYLHNRIDEGLLDDETEVKKFESAFAAKAGAAGAVAVNSGTSALQLALLAVGIKEGDEVIMPSYTCVALYHAIRACKATPVLVDNSFNIKTAQFHITEEIIGQHITPKTRAVIISHMFGTLAPIHLMNLPVPVIEDFTLSLGAKIDGKHAGTLGTIGICSLHHSKMISCGQGGIIVAKDKNLLDKARKLSSYDESMTHWRFSNDNELRGIYSQAYSYNMGSLQAALGYSQLRQLDSFIDRRQYIANYYSNHFSNSNINTPQSTDGKSNVFFRYMVRSNKPVLQVLEKLKSVGIEAGRGVYPPVHVLLGMPDEQYPTTMECINNVLSIPLYPKLTDTDMEYIAEQVLVAMT